MKTQDYWRMRLLLLEEKLNDKGIEYYHTLERAYRDAVLTTNKELLVYYGKLAANNDISMREARKLLTSNELKEFRWTLEEYIAKAEENELTQAWSKQLKNASLKYRISRLEGEPCALRLQALRAEIC